MLKIRICLIVCVYLTCCLSLIILTGLCLVITLLLFFYVSWPLFQKAQELQQTLHNLDSAAQNKHIVFVKDRPDLSGYDLAAELNTEENDIDQAPTRRVQKARGKKRKAAGTYDKNSSNKSNIAVNRVSKKVAKKLNAQSKKQYEDLHAHQQRANQLGTMLTQLQQKKTLMNSKGRVKKTVLKDRFGDVIPEKTTYKWKTQRKR
jgi:Utp11 protein